MNKINILDHYLFEWVDLLSSGEVTSTQLVSSCLDKIDKYDNKIKSFTNIFAEEALKKAAKSDERRSKGKHLSIIDGIPYASKENIEIKNKVAAAGMLFRKDKFSNENSKVITLLDNAGTINLGHLNMHEAALGSTNDNPLHGRTYNPHKFSFTPGGSSGGSGAAVASGFCLFSLGTDTLGSVRIPAAYCGVSGIKPTKGLVSLGGVIPLCSEFDTVGPLARSARDLSIILDILISFDAMCSESIDININKELEMDKKGFIIGCFEDFGDLNLDSEIIEKYKSSINKLSQLGYGIKFLPSNKIDFAKARRSGFKIVEAEAYFHYQKVFENEPEKLSKSLRGFLDYGRKLSAYDLMKSRDFINKLKTQFNEYFLISDLVFLPTTPQNPFEFGEVDDTQADLTCISNLIESPSLSFPVGFSIDKLPIGMQFIGKKYEDFKILKIAEEFEKKFQIDMRASQLA